MIQIKIIVSIFCLQATVCAMQFSSQELIDELLKQPETTFTKQEKNIFQDLKNNRNTSSICRLIEMKCNLNTMMMGKLGHPQYPSTHTTDFFYRGKPTQFLHDEMIKNMNGSLQTVLTNCICKKISCCGKITALTSAAFLLTYGIAVAILDMNGEG